MKVINLAGGPGSGKSTIAAGLFYALKSRYHINCELVSEYAKKLAWENNTHLIADQFHVSASQNRGLDRIRGKVDFAVSDSPLFLGIHYSTNYFLKSLEPVITELFHSYDNITFFVNRKKAYNPKGRFQTEEEAIQCDIDIKNLMIRKDIPFIEINGDETAIDSIISHLDHPSIPKEVKIKFQMPGPSFLP
jgi:hypothetical protein